MALAFSHSDIVKLRGSSDRIRARAHAVVQKIDAGVGTAIETAETGAAAFACGLAQGKLGGTYAVFGVPVDLLGGLALHIVGFMGWAGKNSSHLHAFGNGALASFFAGLGRQVGRSMGEGGFKLGATRSSGELDPVSGGASLADEELARMVAAGKRP